MKETEVAAPIVDWFKDIHADVYQEVEPRHNGQVADIVAFIGKRIWIVETKTSLSLSVMSQATNWLRYAHWVSVGVPAAKTCTASRHYAKRVLTNSGIGVFEVRDGKVRQTEYPSLNRAVGPIHHWIATLRKSISPEHRDYCKAGSPHGGHWTEFKSTCRDVLRAVKKSPGMSMKALIDKHGKFHYASTSSARSCLAQWIKAGKVPGVALRKEGKYLMLYPEEDQMTEDDIPIEKRHATNS